MATRSETEQLVSARVPDNVSQLVTPERLREALLALLDYTETYALTQEQADSLFVSVIEAASAFIPAAELPNILRNTSPPQLVTPQVNDQVVVYRPSTGYRSVSVIDGGTF